MVLRKSLRSKALIVIAAFGTFELLTVDSPSYSTGLAITSCSILTCAAQVQCCCGSPIAAASSGAASCYPTYGYFLRRSYDWREGFESSIEFVDDEEDARIRIKFDTLTSQMDCAYTMDVLFLFWIKSMKNFTKARIGRFISVVFSVKVPVYFSPELLPRARRIAWSHAAAFEMAGLVESHLIIEALNCEVAAAVTSGSLTPEQAEYLKLMSAAYRAYVEPWGNVSAVFKVLAQGDDALVVRMEEAFKAQLRESPWGKQQYMV